MSVIGPVIVILIALAVLFWIDYQLEQCSNRYYARKRDKS